MSVELYPNAEALAEKLSSLEDPVLAERLATANPDLFAGAAAREELSIFAAAWKRFGNVALALTAAASLAVGYTLGPVLSRHAAAPVSKPPAAARDAPAAPKHDAALRAALKKDEAEIARLRARLAERAAAVPVPPAVPVHRLAVVPHVAPMQPPAIVRHAAAVHRAAIVHRPAAAPYRLPAAVYPAAAPQPQIQAQPQTGSGAEGAPGAQTSTASATDTTAAASPSASTDTSVGMPDGTKNPPPTAGRGGGWDQLPAGIGGVILGRTIDPCTPQGGRIGTVLQSLAVQVLTHGRF